MNKAKQLLVRCAKWIIVKYSTYPVSDLEYYYHTSVGLWCIDRNPKDVAIEWIRENTFQLKPIKKIKS